MDRSACSTGSSDSSVSSASSGSAPTGGVAIASGGGTTYSTAGASSGTGTTYTTTTTSNGTTVRVPTAPAPPPRPVVTGAMVAAAFRAMPMPTYRSHVQPVGGKTLVNLPTIFYCWARPFGQAIQVAGQPVRLRIRPVAFAWSHGDGTSATTTSRGAPYPSMQITYRYLRAHVTVRHSVAITWAADWSLNGGGWQPVPTTVTSSGPSTPLRVAEASGRLVGYGH